MASLRPRRDPARSRLRCLCQQGLTRRREAAKRGPGAPASCWQFSAKARSSQQGASAPRPRFAPPRASTEAVNAPGTRPVAPGEQREPAVNESVVGGLAEAATGPSVPPRVQQGHKRRREAAKRGLGAAASCWQFSAKARSSQQGASAPRPRFAPPRVSREAVKPSGTRSVATGEQREQATNAPRWRWPR